MAELLDWLPKGLAALAILVVSWLVWRTARRAVGLAIERAGLDPTASNFLLTILKYVILSIGVVTALGRVGVNTTSILTSLGVVGLSLGFAAKDALSNMISGLFIFWDRPFVLGDLIEVGGHYGRVDRITMRSTRVVTPDGRMLAVPNTIVVNSIVASYTNFPHLRLDIPFSVGVEENLARVRAIALSQCPDADLLAEDPPARVVVTALNDYNIGMELQVWIFDEKQHIAMRHLLREQLFEALRKADVDMPLQTLALRSIDGNSEVSRKTQ
ncbi:mechanosensitive ion channel [Synechococcus sp. CS-1329]|uniref:mechanosensitive ion channel family protein n=1 Tax=Synechococcus sp. CS-1329 TaxID=2847975 RepID=UPI00223C0667|nr:mechanosensitive ion channel [Synechococcus sp. CS-1329]MCT0219099.1 mechanosensitive ion channel [Synechococcus sp. CS-1329]